eukprot:TRINITY_DN21071_c0_g1_i1.p1 TRINITY_DN21071_c0_g1~~TRINITY_DN21071_c0_g1_i1.p1  ORF type:complete len:569 (+),score=95.32 TRINITY_DN21071_c0_g1_i1:72-1778(+)
MEGRCAPQLAAARAAHPVASQRARVAPARPPRSRRRRRCSRARAPVVCFAAAVFVTHTFAPHCASAPPDAGQRATQSPTSEEAGVLLEMFDAETRAALGWNVSVTMPCDIPQWRGIACSNPHSGASVVSIDLQQANLTGTLSDRISQLTELKQLGLGGNRLHGTVPALELPMLLHINLATNQFTGTLPELCGLPELRTADLSFNNFTGSLPAGVANRTELTRLRVVANNLTGLGPLGSPEVSLPNVTDIDISRNRFTGTLPAELGMLPRLEFFQAQENQLSGVVPAGFGLMMTLQALLLSDNSFVGAPPVFRNAVPAGKLTLLSLSGNPWNCPLPEVNASVWVDRAHTTCLSSSHSPLMLIVFVVVSALYAALLLVLLRRWAERRAKNRQLAASGAAGRVLSGEDWDDNHSDWTGSEWSTHVSTNQTVHKANPPRPDGRQQRQGSHSIPVQRGRQSYGLPSPVAGGLSGSAAGAEWTPRTAADPRMSRGSQAQFPGFPPAVVSRSADPTVSVFGPVAGAMFGEDERALRPSPAAARPRLTSFRAYTQPSSGSVGSPATSPQPGPALPG